MAINSAYLLISRREVFDTPMMHFTTIRVLPALIFKNYEFCPYSERAFVCFV